MNIIRPLVRFGITFFLFVALVLMTVTPAASQTAIAKVIVTSVNLDAFPEIHVQAQALDANGIFISDVAADRFVVRENSQPLPLQAVTNQSLPLSVRTVFVIDELSLNEPRLTIVREAIQSFVTNQMRTGDFVSVVAAEDQGQTLTVVPLTSDPSAVVNGMLATNYNPAASSSTELLKAVKQALTDLSALNENTAGVNRIIVFSLSINDQVDLKEIAERATVQSTPIHTVLLGVEDAAGALGRLSRQTRAGKGTIAPEDVFDLFLTFDKERDQDQYLLNYRSKANQAADHELVVEIGGISSDVVTFTLEKLEPPQIRVTNPAPNTAITRTETEFKQDANEVQPVEQTIAVEVTWPDGHPREVVLEKTALIINGKAIGPATVVRNNGEDPVILEFTWDLRQEITPGITPISVVLEVEDELGLKNKSEPLSLTLEYIIFASGAGADACPALVSQIIPVLCSNWNLIVPLASLMVAFAALILVVVFLRRNPKVQEKVKEKINDLSRTFMTGKPVQTRIITPLDASAKASLLVLEGQSGTSQMEFGLSGATTIGRSSDYAKLVLQADQGDRSPISRLHCVLLEKEGRFEIQDQDSSNGTFVNGVRLKQKEVKPLKDGDTVEVVQVKNGGVKFKFQLALSPDRTKTMMVSPNSDEEGRTKTKII